MKSKILKPIVIVLLLFSCENKASRNIEVERKLPEKTVDVPSFNTDSAYAFVKKQVDFGPRVPNTRPHTQTGNFIIEKLEEYGLEVIEQQFDARAFDGTQLYLRNIIGAFNPKASKRILLAAHYDTRPFADKDPDDKDTPIDGANDGASGVAVLLEFARVIGNSPLKPEVGIDLIFFDGEDWGEKSGEGAPPLRDGLKAWWCLGSQYWSNNKHKPGYSAYYGILVDMVGAKNAQFPIEGISDRYAGKVTRKVWDWANYLGYGETFIYDVKQEITDDHVFINQMGKIPMLDIVHYDAENGFFGDFHHSHKDNMDIIDPQTLGMVVNTILHVVYHE